MKKQFLLLSFLAASAMSFAQTSPSFGIRGGLSSAHMKGEAVSSLQNLIEYTNGAINTTSHTGFFAGGYASIPVSEIMSVEPGLYYSQKGYALKGSLGVKNMEVLSANAKAELQSQYIDLPVVLKANIGGLQIFAGPQVSYLAKADLRTSAGVLGFNVFNRKMEATEQFNRWDAGITGGIGYQFGNGFNITAAYDHGLSKTDANKNFDAYNRSFKIGAGFRF